MNPIRPLLLTAALTTMVMAETPPPFLAPLATKATFESKDEGLQRLHDAAIRCLEGNLVQFTPSMKVLVEGGGYPNAWIETQPMGGEMYARRNPQVALNNQVIFMLGQREDGRLPGMVISTKTSLENGWDSEPPEGHAWMPKARITADYEMFQGFCFPEPAWRVYHWIGRDKAYLQELHDALEAHDAYLWRTRDSDGDGILETWCVWDTGEDDATRLTARGAPNRWPFDQPPGAKGLPDPQKPEDLRRYWHRGDDANAPTLDEIQVPFASMDVMAYSYNARATLSLIAAELGNGDEARWKLAASNVRARLIEKLWDPGRHACFDRDRHGEVLPELIHNNLRCMWYGIFTQDMADAFIKHHLLDPRAFWTPVPLPSIAIREPLFRNATGNNWSGQPQGLTYQRAIGALERYGHFAEVTLLGDILLPTLIRNDCRFTQQLDPMTGAPSGQKPDGYGPMALAALEYLSRSHGVHLEVDRGRVWWSVADPESKEFTASQDWGEHRFRMECRDGHFEAFVGEERAFRCTAGVRVVTDLDGRVLEVVGISPVDRKIRGSFGYEGTVEPNTILAIVGDDFLRTARVPFHSPPPAGPEGSD